jgi:hypothetical protein
VLLVTASLLRTAITSYYNIGRLRRSDEQQHMSIWMSACDTIEHL